MAPAASLLAVSDSPAVRLMARALEHLPGKHPQESHGGDGVPDIGALDKLKLGKRIQLGDGERLVSSRKFKVTQGSTRELLAAEIQTSGGREIRLGVVEDGHVKAWTAAPPSQQQRTRLAELDAQLRQMDEDDPAYEDLDGERDSMVALGDGTNRTGALSPAAVAKVRADLSEAQAAASGWAKRWDAFHADHSAEHEERDGLIELGTSSRSGFSTAFLTSQQQARLAEIDAVLDVIGGPDDTLFAGSVPAATGGELHYRIVANGEAMPATWDVEIGIKPPDADEDWYPGSEDDAARFAEKDINALLAGLGELGGTADQASRRPFPFSDSPAVRLMLFARTLERKDFISRGGKLIVVDRDAKGRFGDMLDGPELDAIIANPKPGDRERLRTHFGAMTGAELKAEAKKRGANIGDVTRKDQMVDRIVEHEIGWKLNSNVIRHSPWTTHADAVSQMQPGVKPDPKPRGPSVAKALLSGDPSALDGFNREQLRREAGKRGIALKRGAGEDEIRDALWDHERTGVDDEADLPAGEKAELDLARMTVPQLKERAKVEGVKGYSKMRKPELVQAIQDRRASDPVSKAGAPAVDPDKLPTLEEQVGNARFHAERRIASARAEMDTIAEASARDVLLALDGGLHPAAAMDRLAKIRDDTAPLPAMAKPAVPEPRAPKAANMGGDLLGSDNGVEVAQLIAAEADSLVRPDNDEFLLAIAKRQGFDGKPKVVTKSEMDTLTTRDGGHQPLYRGVASTPELSATEIHEQFRTGEYFAGLNMWGHGNGSYASMKEEMAARYSDGSPGSVMRLALRPDATVVSDKELAREHEAYLTKVRGTMAEAVFADPGRYAAARGYDAIKVTSVLRKDDDHLVILNRTAAIVEQGDNPAPVGPKSGPSAAKTEKELNALRRKRDSLRLRKDRFDQTSPYRTNKEAALDDQIATAERQIRELEDRLETPETKAQRLADERERIQRRAALFTQTAIAAPTPASSNMAKVTADLEALRRNPVRGDREKVAAILAPLKHGQLDQLAADNGWQLPRGATLAQKRAQLEQHYVGRRLTADAIFALGQPR